MEELKSCPFCGGKATLDSISRKGHGGCDLYIWQVACDDCDTKTQSYEDEAVRDRNGIWLTKDGITDAIAAWNKRA